MILRMTVLRNVVLVCIAFTVGCRHAILDPQDVVVRNPYASYVRCLRTADSVTIRVSVGSATAGATYEWETNGGSVLGNGATVTYVAPPTPGPVTVRVRVAGPASVLLEKEITIYVYNQLVMLKADDLTYYSNDLLSPRWFRFLDLIRSRNIVAGLGLQGYSLTAGNDAWCTLLSSLQLSGRFEIWNHGYTHELNQVDSRGGTFDEFQNTTEDFQRNHLMMTQNLARTKLGLTLHAFGAPGNAIDANTTKVIDGADDISLWMNGDPGSSKLVVRESDCLIESPTFHPNVQEFTNAYNAAERLYLFQCHPDDWNEQGFRDFETILDYLSQRGVTFVTPTQYAVSFSSRAAVVVGT